MTTPFPYQLEGVRMIEEKNGVVLLADEMGLGKSFQSLLYLQRHPESLPAVVVCPAALKWNWEREAWKHVQMQSHTLEGVKAKGNLPSVPLYILNYDILHAWEERLRKEIKPRTVILDECQYITNRKARRTKASFRLCSRIPHLLALSGTPLTNRPAELWTVLHLLKPDLFPRFLNFAFNFCDPKRNHWGWDFSGSKNLDVLHNILSSSIMIRRRKEDVFDDLPPKRRIVLPLTIRNREEYLKASRDFLGWMKLRNPDRLSGAERSEQLTRLGYLKRLAAELKTASVIGWLRDFLDGTDGKIIVFAIHKKMVQNLREEFKDTCVVIDGSTSSNNRKIAEERFQDDPSVRMFIGNIVAAGKGLTLTAAHSVAFTELSWTPGEHAQAEQRCWARVNDMHGADIFYLVAAETVEEKLLEIIQKKQEVINQTLDGEGEGDDFNIYDLLTRELIR